LVLFFGCRAFPGVQSSRKGPRGAAKHQYKNLLPIGLAAGGERSRAVESSMGESEPSSEAHDDDEYEEELEASSSSFAIAGSSSSPVSSPQASPVRHRRQAYESSPVSDDSSSSSFYFSSAPGPVPSSPASSAQEDGDQLASSPTLSFSYSSSPSSSPLAVMPMMPHAAEWMPPILQVVDGVSAQHHHCQHHPHHQHEEGAQSSFDDIIDAYGAEAAAAAEQGVWEGDDVEAFFSITTSPYAASSFLMPSAHGGYASFGTDFGFVGANERREEEAQMMWCSSGSSVEDILSANKGEEWIDNILQGCN
jgi:hypothetical protein